MQDGALSDAELNSFQVNCFSAPLQPEELIGVRKVVSESMPQVRPRAPPEVGGNIKTDFKFQRYILDNCLVSQLCSSATILSSGE